ncbi:MAG: hypothetical protein ABIS74_17985 [Ferruginibacter sp.]
MKYLILTLLIPIFTTAQRYDDSTGWVQPYLLSDGRIVGMNTNLLNVDETNADTLFLGMEVEFPASPGVTFAIPGDPLLKIRAIGGISGYAVRERTPALGQYWHIYDELRRPIEFLLGRGARIWKIQQTGQK